MTPTIKFIKAVVHVQAERVNSYFKFLPKAKKARRAKTKAR